MPDAIVMQLHHNEDDTERVYSVDEVCEGKSGIVVATKGANDQWTCQMQEPPVLPGGDQTICKDTVLDHMSAVMLAEGLKAAATMAAVEARELATPAAAEDVESTSAASEDLTATIVPPDNSE